MAAANASTDHSHRRANRDPFRSRRLATRGAPRSADTSRPRLGLRCRARRDRPGRVDRRRRVPARSDRLRPSRPDAALGHDRGGVLPDRLQHRADALHDRDRRAGVHRLHAHAAACGRVGVVLCRPLLPAGGMARVCRRGVGRDLLSVHRADGRPGGRQRRVPDWRLHVPALRGAAAGRAADRANAGAAQLDHGRVHAGRAAGPLDSCWFRSGRGGPRSRDWRDSIPRGESSTSSRPTPISSCSRPSSPTPAAAG